MIQMIKTYARFKRIVSDQCRNAGVNGRAWRGANNWFITFDPPLKTNDGKLSSCGISRPVTEDDIINLLNGCIQR